ncbi:autotransporter outer membrane beta-barrel domain-containing protein [Sphingobium fuliginis]|uniref:Autotransporter outer membrane beta-barrel domain-containing protein n=1 Tax=Sphingobium fuliginis ATCC 27551 TaxID=1208342 RepID=A0A5B8CC33_SPHSA|nr:autotransporter outer membrane beta-barrel domain-containing protein [Sphingobium fuliginis]QDC36859.1 autotransporter outer membrane beta-barrel domain-containing protein [Sphingobium fuliginis ATCC 27551]
MGSTRVNVVNLAGTGGQTREGIKIVDVLGASNGNFVLDGDYMFQGQPAVIAGAYGYRLYKNGIADTADGDWYLRSSLLDPTPVDPDDPAPPPVPPLFQPGVPIYEAYPATLLAMNGLPTLQQRVGNRSWAGASPQGSGIWGRMEASRDRPQASVSTAMADRDVNRWQGQIGTDATLFRRTDGSALIAGIAGHYGEADADVRSVYGNGSIKAKGYGVSASLTWYGPQGFYADAQAKLSWYDSDLRSGMLGKLVNANKGKGQAYGLEVGKRSSVGTNLSLTPQMQMIYSKVDFDSFTDPNGAVVTVGPADSLKTRWGISFDRQTTDDGGRRTHIYGLVNLSYEWLEGVRTEVSGTHIANRDTRLWSELGLGGSYSLDGRFTLYADISANTALKDFGDSYSLKGIVGLRVGF